MFSLFDSLGCTVVGSSVCVVSVAGSVGPLVVFTGFFVVFKVVCLVPLVRFDFGGFSVAAVT